MKRLAIISFLSLSSLISQAPDAYALCDCDHLIATTEITVDGDALGVQPGDSVCLEPGAREALRLANFNGSEGAIIEVRNCEGVAHIENEERGYGITLDDSVHVRITGAGEPDIPYGIYVRAARTGPDYAAMGVAISGYNHDIEVDHLEVVDAGFAGFMVKSDPTCDNPDLSSHTQYNIELHHNYIRTPGGEGFYLGSTGYPSRTRTCDGTDIELYPHWHEGLHVHHNIVEDSAWDGLQVGVTPVDCSIHHNTIINPGLEEVQYQTRGFQFGALSSCDVHGNVLVGGTTIGIFILGAGDMRVYNNVIADFAEDAIYANQSEAAPQGTTYAFAHNTIVRPGGYGIQVFGGDLGPSVAINNIVAEAGEIAIGAGNDVAWTESSNLTDLAVAELGFEDPDNGDYRLRADSIAVDSGSDASGYGVEVDADGVARDSAPDIGAFEYTDEPRPEPGVDPPPTGSTSGCCNSAGAGSRSGGLAALWLAGLVIGGLRRRFRPTRSR